MRSGRRCSCTPYLADISKLCYNEQTGLGDANLSRAVAKVGKCCSEAFTAGRVLAELRASGNSQSRYFGARFVIKTARTFLKYSHRDCSLGVDLLVPGKVQSMVKTTSAWNLSQKRDPASTQPRVMFVYRSDDRAAKSSHDLRCRCWSRTRLACDWRNSNEV